MGSVKREVTVTDAATSALVSSFCASVILQPCDFVKTRLQVASQTRSNVRPSGGLLTTRVPGVLQLVTTAVKENGVLVLWRGTVPSICRVVPGVTLYFTTLSTLQSFVVPSNRTPSALEAGTLAFTSRCFSAFCLVPMTVVKTHFESGVHDNVSVLQTLRKVYKKGGVRGLYSGMTPTLLRDAPFSAFYYMFYSTMKTYISNFRKHIQKAASSSEEAANTSQDATDSAILAPTDLFVCAALSSCFASLLTQPADVLKTRRQMFPWIRISYRFIIKDIYEHEGIQGLFRGILPRLLRRAGMAALSWTLFDTLKQRL